MQQHPSSPNHRRRSSGFSQRPRTTSQSSMASSVHSRKSSMHSQSPRTPTGVERGSFSGLGEVEESPRKGGGLGSLADELAEEGWFESDAKLVKKEVPDVDSEAVAARKAKRKSRLSNGHGGLEYGEDDLEHAMERHLSEVEELTRRGTGDADTLDTGVIARVKHELRNLSSQDAMENRVTQLIKSNVAVASNLANQSRLLISLTRPVVSKFTAPPDPDTASELLELVMALEVPQRSRDVDASLASLDNISHDLVKALPQLQDSCTMVLHDLSEARRCLQSAHDKATLLKKELEEFEEIRNYLQNQNWDHRLANREAAATCGDIVAGFEKTCDQWRQRIAKADTSHESTTPVSS